MLIEFPAGSLPRAVARRHVGDLVRHHARQLGFAIGPQDQARVDEEESSGQRESIHLFGIQHLDGERNLGVGIAHQVLTDPVHVLADDRVVDHLGLALDFVRQLLAQGDLLLQRPEVNAFAHVPIADFVGIVLLVLGKGAAWQKGENCQTRYGDR